MSPRHTPIGRAANAALSFARLRVVHTRQGASFRVSTDEENLTRVEAALGVPYGAIHGEWETRRCAGVRLERDPSATAPAPRVILFAVDRVVGIGDAAIVRFGRCPAFFYREENAPRSRLFERHPEPPVEGPEVDELLAALSNGILQVKAAVMNIIGRTPTMSFGFHTAATYEQSRASFSEDGFEIISSPREAPWARADWPETLVRVS